MLSSDKLKELRAKHGMSIAELAEHMTHGGFDSGDAVSALKNWEKGLFKPAPSSGDIDRLATAIGVDKVDLLQWQSCYRYAPTSASKARIVTKLIAGRGVQDALDVLKFTRKRAATMIETVLKSAIANADEQEADVEKLYISEARVDGAGRRLGTKQWIAKDRGRAHPIRKEASHIYVTVAEG